MQPRASYLVHSATAPALALAAALTLGSAAFGPLEALGQGREPSLIKRASLFAESGGRAVWSPRGDRIAFDRVEPNGYAQLFIADSDLTAERCLTCPIFELRKRHVGNPTWHSSGDFLVVQVEKPIKSGGSPLRFTEVPGGNLGSDLYMIRSDGREYWNLTNLGERGGRAVSARFSHEGDKITWAERLASGGGVFGEWALRVATLEIKRNIPRLKNIKTHKPGEERKFFDSHGFTTDDRGLVLTGNLERGQSENGMDVHLLNTESGETRNLTKTPDQLDRFALMSPNGRWIAWASSRDIGSGQVNIKRRQVSAARPADLWLMNAEGLSAERLTHFNDVHSPQFSGPTMVIPTDWNREGDQLLVLAFPVESNEPGALYLLEFNEPIGR
jgi:Tol biopolymer transport system component